MKYYYFAYGSNMNHEQMKSRCPTASFLGRGKLKGYKFVYDGYSVTRDGAVANVIKANGYVTEGALFEVDDACIKNLDHYEGSPKSYQRKVVLVEDDTGKSYHAFIYLREPQKLGQPSDEYRNVILKGARECGLSEEYIKDYIEV